MPSNIEIFCARWGADLKMMAGDPASHLSYSITGVSEENAKSYDGLVDTLRLKFNGRFGNYVYQLIHMFHVAIFIGATKVIIISTPEISIQKSIVVNNINIALENDVGNNGVCLTGAFFNGLPFGKIMHSLDQSRRILIARTYIRPLMMLIRHSEPELDSDALIINIRSGDIFEGDPRPRGGAGYTQPPLSFYRKVIKAAFPDGPGRITIITEGTLNPVVSVLIEELAVAGHRVLFRLNYDLKSDLNILLNSSRMVFANGSFGIALAMLSEKIREGYFFRINGTGSLAPIGDYLGDEITKHIIIDDDNAYTPFGIWQNSPEQRSLMLDFPEDKLSWLP